MDYCDPAYSGLLARQLQAAGMQDAEFNMLLTGGRLVSSGSIAGYIQYCDNIPVPRFQPDAAHVMVAKRMELVMALHAQCQFTSADTDAMPLLAQVSLLKYPVKSRQI